VDGVLTDGAVFLDESGRERWKRFHVLDGMAVVIAREHGLCVAWISGRQSPVVAARGAELGVRHIFQGVEDKKEALLRIQTLEGVSADQTVYIGDDINDLPAFEYARVRAAVANAHPDLKKAANWVLQTPGGWGALREVVDAVIAARKT
jgi:3-deoxy-D-manno-octulosonate 8-phosphate phosphatase (KDO 8-P phosphatase)